MRDMELGRWMERIERRLTAVERWRASIETMGKALLRRVGIAAGVVALSALINLYPNTEVAKHAESFRVALMRR